MGTYRNWMLAAGGGSLALLAGAFFFQALGWAPCQMCLWQRWPHGAAIVIAALLVLSPKGLWPVLGGLGALAATTTASIGAYHSGVELKWWQGPSSCTGAGLGDLSGAALLPGAAADAPALVLCDTLTPFFLGLTMANWNMALSAGLALVWAWASLRAWRGA